jgi:hypothetical protein
MKEKIYVFAIMALMFGAYFFIHRAMFPPAGSVKVFGPPKVDREKLQQQYIQSMEKRARIMEARDIRRGKKATKEFMKLKPYMKWAEERADRDYERYRKDYERIEKLPPYMQEREAQKLAIKKMQDNLRYGKQDFLADYKKYEKIRNKSGSLPNY